MSDVCMPEKCKTCERKERCHGIHKKIAEIVEKLTSDPLIALMHATLIMTKRLEQEALELGQQEGAKQLAEHVKSAEDLLNKLTKQFIQAQLPGSTVIVADGDMAAQMMTQMEMQAAVEATKGQLPN